MANGILVVPVENELMNVDDDGKKYPIATPTAIAKKIQRLSTCLRNLISSFRVPEHNHLRSYY